ncbi:hypothetical protein F5B22DRAFT_156494 [Xylaria bambusicola]|uniref:uncharacterized protein n=1 Tax=Xylaria bambusicola TaxID=326684 RepID=UPI0020083908|nr:uncharacterized protein F5B22DRAFT_156494 [Xylaria bambusicola]KAI0526398.1 hypothetical protein F5B22DRAFT_156494 [Xylaria bambusicola]
MSPDRVPSNRVPPRPKTPTDYVPTPIRAKITPSETFSHLVNKKQRSARVHALAKERLTSSRPTTPRTPTTVNSIIKSARTSRSALSSAGRNIASSLSKAKPVVETAVAASKKAAVTTANRLTRMATDVPKVAKQKGKEVDVLSTPSSSSSQKSLYHRPRLPKLKIPEVDAAVRDALNSACSTDTQNSENFRILQISPTSRELEYEWQNDDNPPDVAAEFHNMLSARRRVRKGKFGSRVTRYCRERPTWQDSFVARAHLDNHEDRALLKELTDAVQEQKDYAARLVQRIPDRFPGLEAVSVPGSTLKLYWQHKSTWPKQ